MEENINNKKNKDFLEILDNQENLKAKNDQEIILVTTSSWLAQLGSRKNN